MTYCSKCNSPTKSTYLIRQIGILCGNCTKEHGEKEIEKLDNEITMLIRKKNEIHKQVREVIQADCKHENAFNTGYGIIKDGNFSETWRCPDCDFIFDKLIK